MRRLPLAVLIALLAAVLPPPAHACQWPRPDPAPARGASAAAASVVEPPVAPPPYVIDRAFAPRLTTKRIFKRAPSKTFEIAAAKTCAIAFEPGTRWLVYAYEDGDGGF